MHVKRISQEEKGGLAIPIQVGAVQMDTKKSSEDKLLFSCECEKTHPSEGLFRSQESLEFQLHFLELLEAQTSNT